MEVLALFYRKGKEQNSVKEVKVGHECGIKIRGNKKVEVGDVIEFYTMEEPDPEVVRKQREEAKARAKERAMEKEMEVDL